MIYRVLVVDDEPEIRQGLRLKVDWEGLGLQVAGEAANGAEALDWLANEPIDIVITDMNMPVMDGVSFLEMCSERYPSIRLIVITGYEDFHYARTAIRTKVRDYLLKPVSQAELSGALSRTIQSLDDERNERNEREMIEWRLSQFYKEMKEHYIIRLLREDFANVSRREFLERARLFQLDGLGSTTVRFVTTGLRRGAPRPAPAIAGGQSRTPDMLRMPFEMICKEFAQSHPLQPTAFHDSNYPGLMHYIVPDAGDQVPAFLRDLSACISSHLSIEPFIAAGEPVTGLEQWKDGYMSGLLAWSLAESGVRLQPNKGKPPETTASEGPGKLLHRYMSRGELDSVRQTIRQELADARNESQAQFVKCIFQLYLILDSLAHARGVQLDSGEQLWLRPELVLGMDTMEKAERLLLGIAGKIYGSSKAQQTEHADSTLVRAVQQFITENYMYDINLAMLAERFNYNTSYFSEWFKAKAGMTLIQYVTEIRMKEAVRLLENTDLNLWDVAELTGFSNASYFSSKFKRMYGMSPSEYRHNPPEKIKSQHPKK
jgi:two-component system, response regulator YesN